ncbi:MAG: hypothetical protein HQL06_10170 [Nitrospirae bacterium]|nr:hypothetical protein [Nitrospirota bacterium]
MGLSEILEELKNQIQPIEPVPPPLFKHLMGAGETENEPSTITNELPPDTSFLVSPEAKNTEKNDAETIKTQNENVELETATETHIESTDANLNRRIFSKVLNCHVWIVPDADEVKRLRASGVTETIYTIDETRFLRGSKPEHLKAVNEVKTVFSDSRVVSSNPRRADTNTASTEDMLDSSKKTQAETSLPCLISGEVDYKQWHKCRGWSMKYHADMGKLERACRISSDWCRRLYQDTDGARIETVLKNDSAHNEINNPATDRGIGGNNCR